MPKNARTGPGIGAAVLCVMLTGCGRAAVKAQEVQAPAAIAGAHAADPLPAGMVKCDGAGFAPNSAFQVALAGRKRTDTDTAKVEIRETDLRLEDDNPLITPAGEQRGLTGGTPSSTQIEIAYGGDPRNGNGGLRPLRMTVTANGFETRTSGFPRLNVSIGAATLSAPSTRDTSTMGPKSRAVSASFNLAAAPQGLFHPGQNASILALDPTSGAPFLRSSIPIPNGPGFSATLAKALKELETSCAGAVSEQQPIP